MINLKALIKQDGGKDIEANDIQQTLNQKFPDHKYVLYNSFVFEWESDYLSVNENDYIYEFEIKVSLDDFKKDSLKKEKHILLESKEFPRKMPNKFFYACPRGILPSISIPSYAGLVEIGITSSGLQAEVIKMAPFLHRENILKDLEPIFLDKFYFKYKRTEFENYELKKKIQQLEEQLKNKV